MYTQKLKSIFGLDTFRKNQLAVIRNIIERRKDVLGIMHTGFGKSLCFEYPAVYTEKTTIVISPLIALMNDQSMKLSKINIPNICLNGTITSSDKTNIKKDIINNKYRIVYVTPEFIVSQKEFLKKLYESGNLLSAVIDEIHCISSWGNSFRESYRELRLLKTWMPNIIIMAFTATATPSVQKDIIKVLKLKKPYIIKTTFDRPNLYIEVKKKTSPVKDLLKLINNDEPTIVYCQTRKETEKINDLLIKNKIKSGSYHAGMTDTKRVKIQNKFTNDKLTCMVATVAFGMGIDKTIRKVIHYGVPQDIESYYQEIGRAGRDRKPAQCYTFHSPSDIATSNYIINTIENKEYRDHKLKLLNIIKKYVNTNECRRKFILKYFGEEYNLDNCNNCDNCVQDKKNVTRDFTLETIIFLMVVNKTGNRYGINTIISIINGSKSIKVPAEFKSTNIYGCGSSINKTVEWWKILSRMLIDIEFLNERPVESGYGSTLSRTSIGAEWLKSVITKDESSSRPTSDILAKLKIKHQDNYKKLIMNIPSDMEKFEVMNKASNNSNNSNDSKSSNNSNNSNNKIIDITYDMIVNKKMSINDICKKRNLTRKTIENHIVKMYELNYDLDFRKFGFNNDVYKIIKKKLDENDTDRLRSLKMKLDKITTEDIQSFEMMNIDINNLPSNGFTYLQIKLTKAKMNM